jgi:hypothetical protein
MYKTHFGDREMNGDIQKKAIILETNFLVEHPKDWVKIVKRLTANYDVYITKVSIEERIGQKYRELQQTYEKIENFKKNNSRYVLIKYKSNLDDNFEAEKVNLINSYNDQFGDYIIPLNLNEELIEKILERAYRKIPPFLDEHNASDKGFKDTLLWVSLLKYFEQKKEIYKNISIIFLSNDNGFISRNKDILIGEFKSITGLDIDIKSNSYYAQIIDDEDELKEKREAEKEKKKLPPHTIAILRKDISEVITNLCYYEGDALFDGGPTFITHQIIEGDFVESAFKEMEKILHEHSLETSILPNTILGDWSFIEDLSSIPMEYVEKAVELYRTIKNDYKEYIIQFYNAVAKIINSNYRELEEYDK